MNLRIVLFSSFLLATASHADAQLVINCFEDDGDVVLTASGSVNISGLTYSGSPWMTPYMVHIPSPGSPQVCMLGTTGAADQYDSASDPGFSPPAGFGIGAATPFGVGSGPSVGILNDEVIVPLGYVSGDPIVGSVGVWSGESFDSLGLTEGTYVWSWGSTALTTGSVTLIIGENPIPEPSSFSLLGLTGLIAMGRRRARRALS